jgi:hypothetical protein
MAVLLGLGWRFRIQAAVWLSIALGLLGGLPQGVQTAIDLARADPSTLPPAPLFRIAVVVWLVLLAADFHRLRVLRQQRKAELAKWIDQHGTLYDHAWLLSLLQSRTGESGERVSSQPSGSDVPAQHARGSAEA